MDVRKKPVEVEAVYWDGTNRAQDEIRTLSNGMCSLDFADQQIYISTLEGQMTASLGDWVIRGDKGEMYPCKPDIFFSTYEILER